MNVAVVRGRLAAEVVWFTTQAGVRLAGFDLVVEADEGREVVPVTWPDPPALARELGPGDVVVVRGRVRKRFVRTGAGTRPFTDLVATQVAKASRRAAVLRLLHGAADDIVAFDAQGGGTGGR